jgi:CBS domain-containing protein/anti-sigma regulatory factor (Ser/Thr protein kinase)
MHRVPINTNDSPTAMLDLVYRLKVKDVMSTELYTADRGVSMKDVQVLLKSHSITGLPIAEEGELFGIVSMQDVVTALEEGRIDAPVEDYMSRKLIALEDDMPISFAISYFEKYSFHRFPVLDNRHKLVGMVTGRDIITRLLIEANKELERLERNADKKGDTAPSGRTEKRYSVYRHDFENAGHASTEIKKILRERKVGPKTTRRIAIAAYELEMNLVVHSEGGHLDFLFDGRKAVIETFDSGPGIEEVEKALEEGFTTAGEWIRALGFGAGMGLPNVRRVSDEFSLDSTFGEGSHARSVIILGQEEEREKGEPA